MNIKTTMKRLAVTAVGAIATLFTASSVKAATPVVVWDGAAPGKTFADLSQAGTQGGVEYTYTLALGENTSADGSSVTMYKGNQKKGLIVSATGGDAPFGSAGITVIMRGSGMTGLNDTYNRALISIGTGASVGGSNASKFGVASYGTGVRTIYNGQAKTDHNGSANNAFTAAEQTLAMVYLNAGTGSGITFYVDGTQKFYTDFYKENGWKTPTQVYLGGVNVDGNGTFYNQNGMKITQIAIFDAALTQAEIAAYQFPSVLSYEATISEEGTFGWDELLWDTAWAGSAGAEATVTVGVDATVTLPAALTAHKLVFTGAGNLTLNEAADGTTLTAVELDFSGMTGKVTLNCNWGSAILMAGSDLVVDTAKLGSTTPIVGSGHKITYAGTTALSSIPFQMPTEEGAIVVAAPYTTSGDMAFYGNKNVGGYHFAEGATITANRLVIGNPKDNNSNSNQRSQDIYQDGGSITITKADTAPTSTGAALLIGHWGGGNTSRLFNNVGTMTVASAARLGWDGNAYWYIGNGTADDNATATVTALGVRAGADNHSQTAQLFLQKGGTLNLGSYGVSFNDSSKDTLTFAGGTLNATATTTVSNSGTTTSSDTTTLSAVADATLTIAPAIAGTGSFTIAGAGTVVLSAAPTTTGSFSIADGATLSVPGGLTQTLTWTTGATLIIPSDAEGAIARTTNASLDGLTVLLDRADGDPASVMLVGGLLVIPPTGVTIVDGRLVVSSGTTFDLTGLGEDVPVTVEDGGLIAYTEVAGDGGKATFTDIAWEGEPVGSVVVTHIDGTVEANVTVAVDDEPGSPTLVTFPPQIYGAATSFDITFTNTYAFAYKVSGNSKIDTTTCTYTEDGEGAYAVNHPYIDGIESWFSATEEITLAVVGTMPSTTRTTFMHMGADYNAQYYGLLIATGDKADEVIVAWNNYNTVTEICRMSVPNAATQRHSYIVTKKDVDQTTTFTVYLDGTKWKSLSMARFTIVGGFQVGSDFGGTIHDTKVTPATSPNYFAPVNDATDGVINVLRAYNRVITPAEITRYAEVYPYVSENGGSARTLTAAEENWVEAAESDVWTITPAEGDPTTSNEAHDGSAVTLTSTTATTLTVNPGADKTYESLAITGAGSVAFEKGGEGSHSVSVSGAATIGVPVTVEYGSLDLHTAIITMLDGGSLTLDYSGYDLSQVFEVTTVQLTGSIDQSATFDFTAPSATGRTVTYAYNDGTGVYEMTITPTFYTVTWLNEGSAEPLELDENVAHGLTPEYNGETPTKEPTAEHTYTFAGWVCNEVQYPTGADLPGVTAATVFTAYYTESVRTYTVTFENEDGTVLQSSEVEYGTVPTYTGEKPTKTADADGVYTFNGWSPEVSAVTDEATYTAQYGSVAPVASTEDGYFATIEDAIQSGNDATLLNDVALSAPVATGDGAIIVPTGITLDLNGNGITSGAKVILAGGTLTNSGSDLANAWSQTTSAVVAAVELTADSTISGNAITIRAANNGPTSLTLAGNTLTVAMNSGKSLYMISTVTDDVDDSMIDLTSGHIQTGRYGVNYANPTFNCTVQTATGCEFLNLSNTSKVSIKNYVGSGKLTGSPNNDADPRTFTITGTITLPIGAAPTPKVYLADGATIKLNSALDAAYGAKLDVLAGDNVYVDVSDLTITEPTTLIAWGEAKAGEFTAVGLDSAYTLENAADGLKVVRAAAWCAEITVDDVTTKYETLAEAITAANEAGATATVTLLADTTLDEMTDITGTVTLELGEFAIEPSAIWPQNDNLNDAVLCVRRGGSLTINGDGIINATNVDNPTLAVKMTRAGDTATGATATLVVNGGTLVGDYYAISGNGTRHDTSITINGGAITATTTDDSAGIFHPQAGSLIITGGMITGAMAVYVKSGTVSISGGTLTATGSKADYVYRGGGFNNTGDALVIDNCGYPGDVASVTITGGIFSSAHNQAIASYGYGDYAPLAGFVTSATVYVHGDVATSTDVIEARSGYTATWSNENDYSAWGFLAPVWTASTPTGWVDDPIMLDADATAAEAYPALADTELATADAKKLTNWAKSNTVTFPAAPADAAALVDAYLLNCAPTAEAVAAATANFKVSSITVNSDGTVNVGTPAGEYNGTVTIQGSQTLTKDEAAWHEKQAGDQFFRAVLSL